MTDQTIIQLTINLLFPEGVLEGIGQHLALLVSSLNAVTLHLPKVMMVERRQLTFWHCPPSIFGLFSVTTIPKSSKRTVAKKTIDDWFLMRDPPLNKPPPIRSSSIAIHHQEAGSGSTDLP